MAARYPARPLAGADLVRTLLARAEDGENPLVEQSVGGDQTARVDRALPLEGRGPAARLLGEQQQGGDVPGVDHRVESDLPGPLRHPHVLVEVAKAALPLAGHCSWRSSRACRRAGK